MSEFETARNTKTIMIAVVVIVVVIGGGIAGFMLLTGGGTTTTTTGTTTTTTTVPSTVLTILTRHDTSIHSVYEPAFLATDYAIAQGITDIQWRTAGAEFWDDFIDAGTVDVCWGGGPTLFDQLAEQDRLQSLNTTLMLEAEARIPDVIAGVDMKRLNADDELVWIAAAISTFGFDFSTTGVGGSVFFITLTLP